MTRRLLVALCAVAALAPPASAASTADVVREATAKLGYSARGVSFGVTVVARVSEAGARTGVGSVEVRITRCHARGCDKPVRYVANLDADQLEVAPDLSTGSLHVLLFGRALSLEWDDVQGPVLPADNVATSGRTFVQGYRIVSVHGLVAGRRCEADEATLARGAAVDYAPERVAASLPRSAPAALRPLLTAKCAYAHEVD